MQHACGGRKGTHDRRYHLYLKLEGVDLKDSVAFAYGNAMVRKVKNKRGALPGDLLPLYVSDEKDGGDE